MGGDSIVGEFRVSGRWYGGVVPRNGLMITGQDAGDQFERRGGGGLLSPSSLGGMAGGGAGGGGWRGGGGLFLPSSLGGVAGGGASGGGWCRFREVLVGPGGGAGGKNHLRGKL